jgi:hypothetical protein
MSNTISETIARPEDIEASRPRRRSWSWWLKIIVLVLLVFWAAGETVSITAQYTPLRRVLATRLQAAFGRPVEVGSYDFSLWGGPTLNARSVSRFPFICAGRVSYAGGSKRELSPFLTPA